MWVNMKKSGFTLVELLVVIVILCLISGIAYAGVSAVNNNVKEKLWDSTKDLIVSGATSYGEDNKNKLNGSSNCGGKHSNCITVTVGELIGKGYITTKETAVDSYGEEYKVLINDKTGESVNDTNVYIWLENDLVYAEYIEKN